MAHDPTDTPDFWEARYVAGETRWDLGGPSYALQHLIKVGVFDDYPRVFVPGAGNGYDALELARHGHQVTACDFAEVAAEQIRRSAEKEDLPVTVWQRDLFELINETPHSFDAVFEYTCFCAIPVEKRQAYVDVVSHLVRPGGLLLWFVFPLDKAGAELTGPVPHELDLDEIRTLFSSRWDWLIDFPSRAAPPLRRHHERILLLKKR